MILIAALAGCGGGDDAAGSSSTTAAPVVDDTATGATTDAPAGTEDRSASTTPTPTSDPGGSEDDGSDGGATDPACLQGDWEIESDALQQFYGNFMSGVGEIVRVNGAMLLSFDAETYILSTDGRVSLQLQVDGINSVATIDGATAGTYVATDDGVISTHPDRNDFRMTAQVAGVEMDLSGAGLPLDQMFAFSVFECDGDTLRLETQSGGAAPSAFLEFRAV